MQKYGGADLDIEAEMGCYVIGAKGGECVFERRDVPALFKEG